MNDTHINQNQNGNGISGNGHNGQNGQNGKNGEKPTLKFLFVSWESLSGDVAWRLTQEGHEVKYWSKDSDDADVYTGFVEKVERWEDHKDWADVIVFDDTGFGKAADALRRSGKLVVGGNEYTDRLEEDREFGQEEMKRVGMTVLPDRKSVV